MLLYFCKARFELSVFIVTRHVHQSWKQLTWLPPSGYDFWRHKFRRWR